MSQLPSSVQHVVCYLRKSREDEEAERRGEDTLAKQRILMEQDVLSRYNVTYDLAQEVASGDSIRVRPVFQALLPRLGGDYQAVVCKDLSRLGRGSYGDMGIVYDIIRDRRVYVITKDAIYDPGNFSDLRMIRFSLFFNREEYEMTLWRLTEGKYDGAAKGKWVAGSVPYGFKYNPTLQNLEPDPKAAPVIRLIFSLYLQGHGFRSISRELSRLNIVSPRGQPRWRPEVIRRIIKNPAYDGTLVFRKTKRNKLDGRVTDRPASEHIVVERAFAGLVQHELWQRAQNRLEKQSTTIHHSPKQQPTASELSGLITCRQCQHKLIRQHTVQQYKQKSGAVSYYEKEFLYCAHCGYAVKYRNCENQLLEVLQQIALKSSVLQKEIVATAAQAQDGRQDASDQRWPSGKLEPSGQRDPNGKPEPSGQRDPDGKRELSGQQDPNGKREPSGQLAASNEWKPVNPRNPDSHEVITIKNEASTASGEMGSSISQGADRQIGLESLRDQLLQRQRSVEARRARAREYLLDGTFSKEDFQQVAQQIDEELLQIQAVLRADTISRTLQEDTKQMDEGEKLASNKTDMLKDTAANIHTIAEIYKLLSDKSLKNKLLRVVFPQVELELVEKGKGRNHPSSFHLYVTLESAWMSELRRN